ncbi:MAG: hypothetical protein AAGE96_22445 [Cyanobacteria bacterium P01_G01_bin.19]
MITNTVSNINSAEGSTNKIITQSINVTVTKCILQWQTQPAEHYPNIGTDCHCLLRIYDFETENRAVIIASSLWSNNGNRGIWSELNSFAQAIVDRFPQLKPILPNCTFITHSGQFSYQLTWAETFHHDHFDTISITLNEREEVRVDEESETAIKVEQIREWLNQMPLEPVTEILKQLGHDNGWGGVVDDWQIKACWELENGIVNGQVRETGLVGW